MIFIMIPAVTPVYAAVGSPQEIGYELEEINNSMLPAGIKFTGLTPPPVRRQQTDNSTSWEVGSMADSANPYIKSVEQYTARDILTVPQGHQVKPTTDLGSFLGSFLGGILGIFSDILKLFGFGNNIALETTAALLPSGVPQSLMGDNSPRSERGDSQVLGSFNTKEMDMSLDLIYQTELPLGVGGGFLRSTPSPDPVYGIR